MLCRLADWWRADYVQALADVTGVTVMVAMGDMMLVGGAMTARAASTGEPLTKVCVMYFVSWLP
jgi:hypothetical protein